MGNKPSSDAVNPARKTTIAEISVTLTEPSTPRGVTFLLPGFTVDENEYLSTRRVLVEEQRQVVISFPIGLGQSHRQYADSLDKIFHAYGFLEQELPMNRSGYNIVGHSAGGKIALMAAATNDRGKVKTVIALDPVDGQDVEFTPADASEPNLSFQDNPSASRVHITWAADTLPLIPGTGIDPLHDARVIHAANQQWIAPLVRHENASHFCYTDCGGGRSLLYHGGTKKGNTAALADTHNMIRAFIT